MNNRVFTPDDIGKFEVHLRLRNRSSHTIRAYAGDLRLFFGTVDNRVDEMDFSDLALGWLDETKDLAAKTLNRHWTSLNEFAKFQRIANTLDQWNGPTPLRANPHPLPEGLAGTRKMLALCNTSQQTALIALMGLAGLRLSEALSVRSSHFRRNPSGEGWVLQVTGKGNKQRLVPMSSEAWLNICTARTNSALHDNALLVVLGDRRARAYVGSLAQKALGHHASPHDLRATFATHMHLHKHVPLRVIQELLGHASLSTTEVYLGVTMSDMTSAVDWEDVEE